MNGERDGDATTETTGPGTAKGRHVKASEMADVKELLRSSSCYTSLATSDRGGRIDIAPVGSVFLPSPGTIGCLRGPMAASYRNLRENPEAVFLLSNVSRTRLLKLLVTGNFGAPFGYRVHVRLREDRPLEEEEKTRILRRRFGAFAQRKGSRRIARTLNRILLFDIREVREVVVFGGDR